jgi:hypothetical protein
LFNECTSESIRYFVAQHVVRVAVVAERGAIAVQHLEVAVKHAHGRKAAAARAGVRPCAGGGAKQRSRKGGRHGTQDLNIRHRQAAPDKLTAGRPVHSTGPRSLQLTCITVVLNSRTDPSCARDTILLTRPITELPNYSLKKKI